MKKVLQEIFVESFVKRDENDYDDYFLRESFFLLFFYGKNRHVGTVAGKLMKPVAVVTWHATVAHFVSTKTGRIITLCVDVWLWLLPLHQHHPLQLIHRLL